MPDDALQCSRLYVKISDIFQKTWSVKRLPENTGGKLK